MNSSKKVLLLLVGFSFLSFSHVSNATIMTTGCAGATSCTMAELVGGGSLSVDDVSFNSWAESENFLAIFDEFNNFDDGLLDLSEIFVTGIDSVATGNPNEFTLGLIISSQSEFSVTAEAFTQLQEIPEAELGLTTEFNVSASGSTEITGVSLEMGSRDLGPDTQDTYAEVNLDEIGSAFGLQVFEENIFGAFDDMLFDDVSFPPLTSVDMENNIQVGTFDAGTVGLFSYSFLFTTTTQTPPPPPPAVPAPAAVYLLLTGLLMISVKKRRSIKLP
ncbi:MAG: hypothetical protein Alis3KO_03480 [Aliiglaciecola sp.]